MARSVRCWKVNCMEDRYPGLWHSWYLRQVAAVGWPPRWYSLNGKSSDELGWNIARKCLSEVKTGDKVVVALRDHRVGRVGEVVRLAVTDDAWRRPFHRALAYRTGSRAVRCWSAGIS